MPGRAVPADQITLDNLGGADFWAEKNRLKALEQQKRDRRNQIYGYSFWVLVGLAYLGVLVLLVFKT